MKNSDLKAYIKESIINTLSENYIGDEPLDALLKMGTADMNLWHVTKLIDAGILKDSDYKKALKFNATFLRIGTSIFGERV